MEFTWDEAVLIQGLLKAHEEWLDGEWLAEEEKKDGHSDHRKHSLEKQAWMTHVLLSCFEAEQERGSFPLYQPEPDNYLHG